MHDQFVVDHACMAAQIKKHECVSNYSRYTNFMIRMCMHANLALMFSALKAASYLMHSCMCIYNSLIDMHPLSI